MAFKFCPQCAQPLQKRELDTVMRLSCLATDCTYVHWDNPVPVVAAVVEHEGEIILARNKAWPVPFYALITGFLEKTDPSPEEAIEREVMEELGLHTQTGSIVYGDNQSTLAVSHNGVKGERTKHVDVKYHFVTETVERGDVQLRWVPTQQQQADIFPKALSAPAFEVLRSHLMSH